MVISEKEWHRELLLTQETLKTAYSFPKGTLQQGKDHSLPGTTWISLIAFLVPEHFDYHSPSCYHACMPFFKKITWTSTKVSNKYIHHLSIFEIKVTSPVRSCSVMAKMCIDIFSLLLNDSKRTWFFILFPLFNLQSSLVRMLLQKHWYII